MLGANAMSGVGGILRAGSESGRRGPRRRRRDWAIEALEGRALLSVYMVDSLGDAGVGTGSVGDLRYAIEQADRSTSDSTIEFAPGLSGGQITLTQGMLAISKPTGTLTIRGPGADDLTISGGGHSQVFTISPRSDVVISGLTISDGIGSEGGGIQNDGTLALVASTIVGNSAAGQGGGGIANSTFGRMTIADSTIVGNRSLIAGGGGIANAGTLTIDESTVTDNTVVAAGGGGISNTAALTMTDDTVSDNTATSFGGGVVNLASQGGTISMDNTIVADNDSASSPLTDDLYDSGDFSGSYLTGSNDLIEAGNLGSLTQTISGVDPLLGPLQNNGGPTWTQALRPGSPAIAAGAPTLVPAADTTDQRGFGYARIVRGQLDLGAFEVQVGRPLLPAAASLSSGIGLSTEVLVGLTIAPTAPSHPVAATTAGGTAAAVGS